jgi:hypothetical protein
MMRMPVDLSNDTTPPPRPRWRRARRWLLGLVALAALAEGASYFAYWAADGQPFSYAQAEGRRHRLTAPADDGTDPGTFGPSPQADIHPYLGFCYDPNFRGRHLPGEAPPTEWGFTDPANRPPLRKRGPGKVVVGILGASVASIFAGQGTEALARELKRSPQFSDKEIEFVSIAIGSFKQPQQLMAFNYALAMGAEFDVLINLDGLNEVAWYCNDNWPHGVSRLYPIGWHWFVPPGRLAVMGARSAQVAYAEEARRRWAALFECAPLRYSVAANLVWLLRDQGLEDEATRRRPQDEGLPYRARGPEDHFAAREDALKQLVADWEQCSLLIHQICQARGIRYYHFLQPNQYVPGSKPLSAQERLIAFAPTHPSRPAIEQGYVLLREAGRRLAARGVRFHDISMAYARSSETFYNDNCCHINRAGSEALAGPMARAIVETPEPPLAQAGAAGAAP